MNRSITTLALNLLISERKGYRTSLADNIRELLMKNNGIINCGDRQMTKFISLMQECVEDPTCEMRNQFYQMAHQFNQEISKHKQKVSIAA